MKIAICGSMTFAKEMIELKQKLELLGHYIILPQFTYDYIKLDSLNEIHNESAKNKIAHDLIKKYFEEIESSEAILVLNRSKKEIENYIGGNSLIEMAFAHILNKKIFLLNPIPKMPYTDEIVAMKPEIINNNLDLIK